MGGTALHPADTADPCHCFGAGLAHGIFYIVTTLLDAERYPAAELVELYLQRWNVELFFRHMQCAG